MFPQHMRRVDKAGKRVALVVAAVVILACQLLGVAWVADGQVKKSRIREAEIAAQNLALASCLEANAKFSRKNCISLLRVDKTPDTVAASVASQTNSADVTLPAFSATRLVSVVFATR